jgi:hypothetical protein
MPLSHSRATAQAGGGLPSLEGAEFFVGQRDLAPADRRQQAAQQAGIPSISPRTALICAGAAALAADDDEAGPLFEAALALPEADRWPFEQARIQLAYGQWLRRTRDTTHARLHLRAALDTSRRERLYATHWRRSPPTRTTRLHGRRPQPKIKTADDPVRQRTAEHPRIVKGLPIINSRV